jgi:hypothetical protein
MISGVLLALLFFGVLAPGGSEAESQIAAAHGRAADDLEVRLSGVSEQAVMLSESLTSTAAALLADQGLAPGLLHEQPEFAEDILFAQAGALIQSLEREGVCGAFVLLDASSGGSGSYSRAGLYLQEDPEGVRCLRGPRSVLEAAGLEAATGWEQELDIQGRRFVEIPAETAESFPAMPPSLLYWWGYDSTGVAEGEKTLLCSVPLIGSDYSVFGICGLEVEEGVFRPDSVAGLEGFPNAALHFSEGSADRIVTTTTFEKDGSAGGLDHYLDLELAEYVGLSGGVRLYAEGSPFEGGAFSATLLVPKGDVDAARAESARPYLMALGLVCLAGIIFSAVTNRRLDAALREEAALAEQEEAGAAPG